MYSRYVVLVCRLRTAAYDPTLVIVGEQEKLGSAPYRIATPFSRRRGAGIMNH